MKNDYIRQHYVWRYYLKPWSDNNQIWCKRNNSIFQVSLMKIAQEKYFYKSNELNDFEIDIILKLINSMPKENQSLCMDNLSVYLSTSNGIEYFKRNGIEIYHGIVEKRAKLAIDNLNSGNISILDDEEIKIDFCKFIGRQYTRTKKIKDRLHDFSHNIPLPDEYVGKCDVNKILEVMNFIRTSDSIGNWIFSKAKINLIENRTNLKFITSDQPVFNIKSMENEISTEMEIFYPISPSRTLLITKDKVVNTNITEMDVEEYNKEIIRFSYEMIFGTSKIEIEKYT